MSEDYEETPQTYTVRLELVDRPGELLRALEPIADHGGNLLSIFHERGNITPRGHIPVEIDLECPPERIDVIVDALRDAGVNVMQAGAEEYSEEVVVVLVGPLIETDLSDTISTIESSAEATIKDFALSAPSGRNHHTSARVRLATAARSMPDALASVRELAREKGIRVIAPVDAEAAR